MRRLLPALAIVATYGVLPVSSARPHFFPDDPIWVDDDRAFDASGARPHEDSNGYDFLVNTFLRPGERRAVRAMNINTVDEVPDSSWFTNRIGRRAMSVEDVVRGPDRMGRLSLDGWVISGGKSTGVQAGFRMQDPDGHTYQIEFDPPSNPEMASGAEIIGTAFYHAFGYHVVDVYLTEFDPATLTISPRATIRDVFTGERRRLERRDLDAVLARAARLPNGRYRALASRFADGRPLGNFRYYGTRPDDPNDIVPHEHRRELRGARVFAAWLNHDDSRGVNSLDMLETTDGRGWIKHYMFDFGSILGSGTVFSQRHRAGHEYIFEWKPGWLTLATLGGYIRPWMLIRYPRVPPSVGRFEADAFDPIAWKAEYPNTAFQNMQPDDAFWAARIVSRFTDEMIAAIVGKAEYSDAAATRFLTEALITRRDKVLRAWLTATNPVVDPVMADGRLRFANAAVDAGVATPPADYSVQWFLFDNASGTRTPVGAPVRTASREVAVPDALRGAAFAGATITAPHPDHPVWSRPVEFVFRGAEGGWTLVGVRRP
ncbi:MAG: hypothetical protein AB1635_21755 [Acidobacteriota bacterium]